jgi:CRISPR-associated protein Cas1
LTNNDLKDINLQFKTLKEWKNSRKHVFYVLGRYNLEIKNNKIYYMKNNKEIFINIDELDRLIVIGKPCFGQDFSYTLMLKGINVEFYDYFFQPKGILYSTKKQEDSCLFLNYQNLFESKISERLNLANLFIEAKIKNSISVLKNRQITVPQQMNINFPLQITSFDKLRGIEGIIAKVYFRELALMVEPFKFESRQPRPAPDPINLMLSFGYSLIYNRFGRALLTVGLNPRIGFFHVGRGTHWALASDLMEDLRFVVDRFVIKLVRQNRIKPDDFKIVGQQCSFLRKEVFKLFVTEFEDTMNNYFSAPVSRPGYKIGDEICFNQWIDATAKGYASFISNSDELLPFTAHY